MAVAKPKIGLRQGDRIVSIRPIDAMGPGYSNRYVQVGIVNTLDSKYREEHLYYSDLPEPMRVIFPILLHADSVMLANLPTKKMRK